MNEKIAEKKSFDANVNKLLNLMINSLYTNKDISIREIISNAVDACEKAKYLSLQDDSVMSTTGDFKIHILLDKHNMKLEICDNGIGMNKEELDTNLGVIANSGTQKFLQDLEEGSKKTSLIGNFGVGFYSIFMISQFVEVTSKKLGQDQAYQWSSDGTSTYTIQQVDTNITGTKISAKIKAEDLKYLELEHIKSILEKYSVYLPFPISISYWDNDNKMQEMSFDSKMPVWKKNKNEVNQQEYLNFYHDVAPGFFDKPWMTLHNSHEGMVEFFNLLFIPSEATNPLLQQNKRSMVRLYINNVFITDNVIEILPNYMRFIYGVIEISKDNISLNISRETFQKDDPSISKIRSILVKKVFSELTKIKNSDKDKYLDFWKNFGPFLKEGIYEDTSMASSIFDLCFFYSAIEKKMISLQEYVDNIKSEDKKIFYLVGNDVDKMISSPQIEGLLADNIDVLLMSDSIDSFILSDYKAIPFVCATAFGIESEQHRQQDVSQQDYKGLTDFFKQVLKDQIADVKISKKLIKSPVCLVTEKKGMNMMMEKILLNQGQSLTKKMPKYLEINANHPLIQKIYKHVIKESEFDDSESVVNLLFNQALLMEGYTIEDPKNFCDAINSVLVKV